MPNREFPFNQPIHPEDNQSINKVFDRNYGNRIKSGDTTPLKYTIKDGDGEPLDKTRLLAMDVTAILKYEDIVAYETEAIVTLEDETENYAGDLVARFTIQEALAPSATPYVLEFHFENGESSDRFIFPSANNLDIYITPSALNSDDKAIEKSSEQRLKEIVESSQTLTDVKMQEEERIANEEARQAKYIELVDTGIMQENINQKLSESEQTYAPRLTDLEQNDADLTAQVAQKADKSKLTNVQGQVDNLVLGAVGDGNNPEIIQARGIYPLLNARLNNVDGSLQPIIDETYTKINAVYVNKTVLSEDDRWVPKGVIEGESIGIPDSKSVAFDVDAGFEYEVQILGSHDRLRVVGVDNILNTAWDEKILFDDSITGTYTFTFTPVTAKKIYVYLSANGQTPTVDVRMKTFKVSPEKTSLVKAEQRNVFVGYHESNIVISNTYITRSNAYNNIQVNTAILDINPGETYKIRISSGTPDRWQIGVMNTRVNLDTIPTFNGDEGSYIELDRLITPVGADEYGEVTFTNTNGVQLFIYTSASNQNLPLEIITNEYSFRDNIDLDNIEIAIGNKNIKNKAVSMDKTDFITTGRIPYEYLEDSIIVMNEGHITRSALYNEGMVNTAVFELKENTEYIIRVDGEPGNAWRASVLNEPIIDMDSIPTYASGDSSAYIQASRILVTDNVYREITFNSGKGKQLFVYTSNANERVNLIVEEAEISFTKKLSPSMLPDSFQVQDKPIFLDTVGLYDSPNLDGVSSTDSFFLGASMVDVIYQSFDELVSENPKYVTKHLLGNEPVKGLPIYEYHFKPEVISSNRDKPTNANIKLPKVLLTGNIHGEEKQGTWSILKFFEEVCRNWQSEETLEFFRHNIEFRIVPVINPHAYNANVRLNGNGRDLNREFAKPFEQMEHEAQLLANFIDDNLDADWFIDCHTMWRGRDRNTVWIINPDELNELSNTVIHKLTRKWKKQYPFITYEGLMGYIGSITYDGGGVGQMKDYAYSKGIHKSVILELANHVDYEIEPLRYGKLTTNMYVDLLANYLVAVAIDLGASYN